MSEWLQRVAGLVLWRLVMLGASLAASGPVFCQMPPRITRPPPALGPFGSVTENDGYSPYQSAHHSRTLPCISWRPLGFAGSDPTRRDLPHRAVMADFWKREASWRRTRTSTGDAGPEPADLDNPS